MIRSVCASAPIPTNDVSIFLVAEKLLNNSSAKFVFVLATKVLLIRTMEISECGKNVSKRVFLTLPDGIAEDLERWAETEGNKAASLAGFIVEQAVRQAKEQGKIPPKVSLGVNSVSQLIQDNWSYLVDYKRIPEQRLMELKDGREVPTELELARLALALDLEESYIESLLQKP